MWKKNEKNGIRNSDELKYVERKRKTILTKNDVRNK